MLRDLALCCRGAEADEDETPWVQQGDLQLQLGANCYSDIGKEALDRAVRQHGGGIVVCHTNVEILAQAEQDEEMRRALVLEQRICALDATV